MNEISEVLNHTFLSIPNWKWLTLVAAAFVLYSLRSAVLWICLKIKKAEAHFEEKSFPAFFFEQNIEKPVSWLFISAAGLIIVEYLNLPESFAKYLIFLIKLLLTINVIRICYMAADAFGNTLEEWALHTDNQFDDQLAPFAGRALKVLVIIIGVLVGLQNFGVNVTALLAGLGIGGVALAFAAQDTVANVFGTITIILDQPFKLGDTIKVGDTEGTVYEVGFRSTRIKTPHNSIVSIPNSVMAKERIDNLTERQGWIRFRQIFKFSYSTSQAQIKQYCDNVRYRLTQDESIDRNRIVVSLNSADESGVNVLVNFHFQVGTNESESEKVAGYVELGLRTTEELKIAFAKPN